MKIAIITKIYSRDKGGAERYAVNLADALLNEGHEVHVFANLWDIPNPPVSLGKRIIFHRVPMGIGPRFLKLLSFHWRCRRQLKPEQFDIVYSLAQTYPADIYRMSDGLFRHWISLRYPNPIIRLLCLLSRPVFIFNLVFEKRILQSGMCRLVIANSNLCRQQAESYYSVHPERIEVIYNGVDLDTFNRGAKMFRSEIRKSYNIPEDAPLLLFVSMNFSRKGLSELIRSLPLVRTSFPGLRLMVVGKGDPVPYRKTARALGLEEALVFVGPAKETAPFYGAADLFVLPTHYDPFANVCLEAMACGLPVVTTRQNGASELIEEGVNGYIIDRADKIDDMVKKIIQSLLSHSQMGDKASETAMSFSKADHTKKIMKVYHRIAAEKIPLEIISHRPLMVINRALLPILKKNHLLSYDQIMTYHNGITLKQIRARTIKRLMLKNEKGEECLFYLKRHCSSFSFSSIAKRWHDSSEGRREWNSILAFHEAGLPTMVPVAMGEGGTWFSRESFLMTEALNGYEPMEKWIPSTLIRYPEKERPQIKRELIRKVALLARKMNQAGFYHRDYYLTHILLKEISRKFDLKIIDLQRVIRYPWFKGRWKIKDLASLNYSAPQEIFTGRDRLLFYKFYEGGRRLEEVDLRIIKMIQKKTERIDKHTIRMYQTREARKRLGLLEK
ncbi:MAG: glycosyltransferase [Nitrospirae bacterium]|nr:glycosyltransferase [Nitrospirota bacterium]